MIANEEARMYQAKDGAILRFFWQARKNEFRSKNEGKPIFDKSLLVEITTPGSRDSTPVKEVRREYENGDEPRTDEALYSKYREYIEDFISDTENPDLLGTPLSAWPSLDITQVAMLKALGIFTVESLAELPDGKIGNLGMGGRALVERAKTFIAAAKGNSKSEELATRVTELEDEIKRRDAQIAELDAKITALTKESAEKPAKVKV